MTLCKMPTFLWRTLFYNYIAYTPDHHLMNLMHKIINLYNNLYCTTTGIVDNTILYYNCDDDSVISKLD